ncbi:contractile injection system tape measure protein [Flammeovirga kamogawensis]|uniref:Uncharacterized protein n=1 Tax=Flammeovirga kamogawensis TaxID=373891 RepID=A0ABX8GXW5_9BACT|nr:contractile injection system tape measure protein [Flammeovirga kamogawensis]MBB6458865.1 hypothetical protein [Flammeovirga kamogawensis]QWG08446.1 hypothetical protein KM029_05785 [Flammeovirga kamogawensis]TRX66743.1 hypothetical protein EO216_00845 [Flammeovirga kamogawensis]
MEEVLSLNIDYNSSSAVDELLIKQDLSSFIENQLTEVIAGEIELYKNKALIIECIDIEVDANSVFEYKEKTLEVVKNAIHQRLHQLSIDQEGSSTIKELTEKDIKEEPLSIKNKDEVERLFYFSFYGITVWFEKEKWLKKIQNTPSLLIKLVDFYKRRNINFIHFYKFIQRHQLETFLFQLIASESIVYSLIKNSTFTKPQFETIFSKYYTDESIEVSILEIMLANARSFDRKSIHQTFTKLLAVNTTWSNESISLIIDYYKVLREDGGDTLNYADTILEYISLYPINKVNISISDQLYFKIKENLSIDDLLKHFLITEDKVIQLLSLLYLKVSTKEFNTLINNSKDKFISVFSFILGTKVHNTTTLLLLNACLREYNNKKNVSKGLVSLMVEEFKKQIIIRFDSLMNQFIHSPKSVDIQEWIELKLNYEFINDRSFSRLFIDKKSPEKIVYFSILLRYNYDIGVEKILDKTTIGLLKNSTSTTSKTTLRLLKECIKVFNSNKITPQALASSMKEEFKKQLVKRFIYLKALFISNPKNVPFQEWVDLKINYEIIEKGSFQELITKHLNADEALFFILYLTVSYDAKVEDLIGQAKGENHLEGLSKSETRGVYLASNLLKMPIAEVINRLSTYQKNNLIHLGIKDIIKEDINLFVEKTNRLWHSFIAAPLQIKARENNILEIVYSGVLYVFNFRYESNQVEFLVALNAFISHKTIGRLEKELKSISEKQGNDFSAEIKALTDRITISLIHDIIKRSTGKVELLGASLTIEIVAKDLVIRNVKLKEVSYFNLTANEKECYLLIKKLIYLENENVDVKVIIKELHQLVGAFSSSNIKSIETLLRWVYPTTDSITIDKLFATNNFNLTIADSEITILYKDYKVKIINKKNGYFIQLDVFNELKIIEQIIDAFTVYKIVVDFNHLIKHLKKINSIADKVDLLLPNTLIKQEEYEIEFLVDLVINNLSNSITAAQFEILLQYFNTKSLKELAYLNKYSIRQKNILFSYLNLRYTKSISETIEKLEIEINDEFSKHFSITLISKYIKSIQNILFFKAKNEIKISRIKDAIITILPNINFSYNRIFTITCELLKLNYTRQETITLTSLTKDVEKTIKKCAIKIPNAGLVIIAPYIQLFFNRQGLLKENNKAFKNEKSLLKGVALLLYIAHKNVLVEEESQLILPKILCGLKLEETISIDFNLTDDEKESADFLLSTVIEHWSSLKQMEPDSLRVMFFIREGLLTLNDDWTLEVEKGTYDIFVKMLPWSIKMTMLPWMDNKLNCKWGK